MSKYIINNSGSEKTYKGIPIADGASFQIAMDRWPAFASCDPLVEDVGAGIVDMSVDGVTPLSIAKGLELLVTVYPVSKELTITQQPAFSAKTVDGKNLYNRTTGHSYAVTATTQDLKFEIPFAQMKFNGLEVIGATLGDSLNLYVWDSVSGTYTTVPNYPLNQFGYTVFPCEGKYSRVSKYDADIYLGMQIVVEYTSVDSKTIYINYDLHELKA